MNKYFVVFTEETIKSHGFYVEADTEDDAYLQAEDKYFNYKDADVITNGTSRTLGHEVVEA